jgi:hypothetical protein
MKLDSEIDDFVHAINRGPRDRGDGDEVPPSVAQSGPDEDGELDWQIRPFQRASWIAEMEAIIPAPLPPSYRSLVTRYVFPAFQIPGAFLFANTPEGTTHFELRRRLREPIAEELMATGGLVQFANPFQYNYDPVCFATGVGRRRKEFPIVRVDHEDILLGRSGPKVIMVAESFLDLVRVALGHERAA